MRGGDRTLRVALVSSDISLQSGAAWCSLEVARGLQRRSDVEPILYLSSDGPLSELAIQEGISVRITGVGRPSLRKGALALLSYLFTFPWHCARLASWFRKDHIDLVNANEFIEFQAGVAGWLVRLPRVYHIRWPLDEPFLYRMLAKITGLLATDLVAASRATAEACFRACGRRPTVVYDPGPDTETFKPSDSREEVLEEFSLPPDTQLITLVSKLVPEKGHETLLRAAGEVVRRHPSARFLVVGGELPGGEHYARRLYELAEQGPLNGRVIFTGARKDVARLLGASAIAVHLPIFPDPFPGVVLEAMSCGCAVVAANTGGVPEQITDGVDGILVEPGSAPAVAAALGELLGDPQRRRSMGRAARRAIVARFGLDRNSSELTGLYQAAVRRRPPGDGAQHQ